MPEYIVYESNLCYLDLLPYTGLIVSLRTGEPTLIGRWPAACSDRLTACLVAHNTIRS